jgi:hypothetical protein
VARLYTNPADPAVDVLTLWLAGSAWLIAVVAAGWLAGRDPEAHAGSGAWAGGNVGALAWLLGAAPVLGAWSQRPVLVPTVGPDAGAVLVRALADATAQALVWSPSSATMMIAGGAMVGWLAARGWQATWRAPDGVAAVVASASIVALALHAGAVHFASSLVDSVVANVPVGELYASTATVAVAVPSMLTPVALGLACAAACLMAAMRAWRVPATLGFFATAAGAGVVGAGLAALGASAVVPVVVVSLGAGVACAGSVSLRPRVARSFGVAVLELTPGFATIGSGAPSILVGITTAMGATRRIVALTDAGAAAPADVDVTPELLAVWSGAAPGMLVMAGLTVGVAWGALAVVGRFLPMPGPVSGDAA